MRYATRKQIILTAIRLKRMLIIWAIDWSMYFEPTFVSGDGILIELLRSGYARQTRAFPDDTSFSGSVSPRTPNEDVC
jgi:hypothetical protein